MLAPTSNRELEFTDLFFSVSDIQNFMENIIKTHETLPTDPPIHIYINRINKV